MQLRKVVLIMTASLDGYVVAPEGSAVGGEPEQPELKQWKLARISRAGTHIMGRVTYDAMGAVWPNSKDDYAGPMNDIPKVVFSKSLKEATWPESRIASGDLAHEIEALKNEPGGEIIAWGGARFAQSLAREGLVDEYAIITRPLAYGGGKPLFLDLTAPLELDALATTTYASGHVLRQFRSRR
jgi:dihydrofolate reductase